MSVTVVPGGDLTTCKSADAIVHVANCCRVIAHGLSAAIAEAYPWADIYSLSRTKEGGGACATVETRGIPGTIKIYRRGNKGEPAVVCFLAQWEYGRASDNDLGGRKKKKCRGYDDTTEERTKWFEQCLNQLAKEADIKTIAFPYKIGCGLGGQDWSVYSRLIEQFAVKTGKDVLILRNTTTSNKQLKQYKNLLYIYSIFCH